MGLVHLGLLNDQPHPSLQSNDEITWKDFMCDLLHLNRDTSASVLRAAVLQKLQNENQLRTIEQ